MDEVKEYIERDRLYELGYWHGETATYDNPFPEGVDAVDTEDIDSIQSADVVEKETVKKAFAEACQECRDACEEFDGFYADCNQCLLHGVKEKLKDVLEG